MKIFDFESAAHLPIPNYRVRRALSIPKKRRRKHRKPLAELVCFSFALVWILGIFSLFGWFAGSLDFSAQSDRINFWFALMLASGLTVPAFSLLAASVREIRSGRYKER